PLPTDLRVPAVLEELGENLLRACPASGALLTAGEADSYAAWYMRFARGLRPDLLVLPLAAWRSDALLRARLGRDLKLARRSADDGWLGELAKRRPVCVSMAFERPPDVRPRVAWAPRSLVWVAGPQAKGPAVPARPGGGPARSPGGGGGRRAPPCAPGGGWGSTRTTPGPIPPSARTRGRRD